jgi:DNA ligase (NAD+)
MNPEERIKALIHIIEKHNHSYYVLNSPDISDYEYDMLYKELEELELSHPDKKLSHSPTQRVGSIVKGFDTELHSQRMYSLDNSYNKEDLFEWVSRLKKVIGEVPIEYTCELKYDGASISLTYENGQLIKALTRGDGTQGDNVTSNIRTIKSIPLTLKGDYPSFFEIRGEVVLPFENFKKLNDLRASNGEEPFMNPRNTASGSLKIQDPSIVSQRGLDCLLYQLAGNFPHVKTQSEFLEKAASWGFKVPNTAKKCGSIEEVLEFISFYDTARHELPYETDGVVVKVNSLEFQAELGYTAKSPRWAMAYKFKADSVESELESIDYQVGRTGAITPVANLSPVLLAGTVVKRASLHNADQIEKLDIRIGDTVFVEKGGEIIPKITGVNFSKRPLNALILKYITHCPKCNSPLHRVAGDAKHFCLNERDCPPQIIGKISHFISRKALDIDGLGEETVSLLYENKLIQSYADLYTLNPMLLIQLDRMAQKSVDNMLNGIEASKQIPFEKVLFGLGIRFVGETVAKKLARSFGSISALRAADYESLIAVDEIGDVIAKSVLAFFEDSYNNELVNRLASYGLQMELSNEFKLQGHKLTGLNFVISGVFETYSRPELKQLIELNGGKVVGSLSSKTSYLLAGDQMGPSKKAKAISLDIPLISVEDFLKMIS